jgi:hypothetical protein
VIQCKAVVNSIGSLRDNGDMGRPKNFSREGVHYSGTFILNAGIDRANMRINS